MEYEPQITQAQDPIVVENLTKKFGNFTAVDGVSFNLRRGECVALAGESGCGKSVTSLAIMRLLSMPPTFVPAGEIVFDGRDPAGDPGGQAGKLKSVATFGELLADAAGE